MRRLPRRRTLLVPASVAGGLLGTVAILAAVVQTAAAHDAAPAAVQVPRAARAVDTRHPDRVVGKGTPAGCTSAAVVRAVAAGGIITFDCGPKPITILMTSTATVI